MKTLAELVAEIACIQEAEVAEWIAAAWLHPIREEGRYLFSEAEEARLRLIVEMRYDLGVETETMPLLLSLLDQLYGARCQLHALSRAVAAQPETVRAAIYALLRR